MLQSEDKKVQVNCDDKRLEQVELVDQVKYDKIEWMSLLGRFEHKLFFNERVAVYLSENQPKAKRGWLNRAYKSISSFFG